MNEEISVGNLAETIAESIGVDIEIISDTNRKRPNISEVERLCCDNSKIFSKTRWRPEYTLKSGLNETINWIKQHLDIYKVEIYNV